MANKHTLSMMSMLPGWMKMAKDEKSVGAKFLNAFAIEMSDIERYLELAWENMYIGTANLQEADYCYKIPLVSTDVADISKGLIVTIVKNGTHEHVKQARTLRVFFESTESVWMYDSNEGFLYVKPESKYMKENIFQPFHAIGIDETLHYDYMLHHIWNIFDEFGMLLGIKRLIGERNKDFKNRILDVFRNPGGSNKRGIINGVSRELGIEKSSVKLGSLADKQYVRSELVDEDGVPTERYIKYVNQINESLGFSWDHMLWGEAYWRSIEEDNLGIHYLPHIWDGFSFTWKDHEIQSGIGSGDDLLVNKPKQESSTRSFKAYVGLCGTEERTEDLHPEIHFKYKIQAKGKIPNDEKGVEEYRYSILASEIVQLHYILSAYRTFLYKTYLNWSDRYPIQIENSSNPGIEIVEGDTPLHDTEDPNIRLHVELKTSDRTVTPLLKEITLEWLDTSNKTHSTKLMTSNDFTQNSTSIKTKLEDVEVENNAVRLTKGSFGAVIDTEGSFSKGIHSYSVRINKGGSISLDI